VEQYIIIKLTENKMYIPSKGKIIGCQEGKNIRLSCKKCLWELISKAERGRN
jgi:hypothetical protein